MRETTEATRLKASTGAGGFTLLEVLVVVTLLGIAMGIAFSGWQSYNRAAIVDRAARALTGDVAVTRSQAIQQGQNVSLVADQAARTYEIRTNDGLVLANGDFSAGSDIPLTSLSVSASGDSLTFNPRGMLVQAPVTIEVERMGQSKRIEVNALGRTHREN